MKDKEAKIVPKEVRKEGKNHHPAKPPLRRVRGKLSKKEEKEMKKKHRDITRMMAPPPTHEATNYEKRAAKKVEELERINEEREARLERIRRRKLEWSARRAQKTANRIKQDVDTGVKVKEDAKMVEAPEHNMNKEMKDQAAHTPGPGTSNQRKEMLDVMTHRCLAKQLSYFTSKDDCLYEL